MCLRTNPSSESDDGRGGHGGGASAGFAGVSAIARHSCSSRVPVLPRPMGSDRPGARTAAYQGETRASNLVNAPPRSAGCLALVATGAGAGGSPNLARTVAPGVIAPGGIIKRAPLPKSSVVACPAAMTAWRDGSEVSVLFVNTPHAALPRSERTARSAMPRRLLFWFIPFPSRSSWSTSWA